MVYFFQCEKYIESVVEKNLRSENLPIFKDEESFPFRFHKLNKVVMS